MSGRLSFEGRKELINKVETLLKQIDQTGEVPEVIVEQPGEFFREFFEAWYANGGLVGGRPRNSIRRMRNEWLVGENAVPSLHPKLQGEVKLGRSDAKHLTRLFLAKWEYVENKRRDSRTTTDGYLPFPSVNQDSLNQTLIDTVFGPYDQQHNTVILLSGPRTAEVDGEDDLSVNDYRSFIRESNASIIVSAARTVLGPTPHEAMRLWWHLVNNFSKDEDLKDNMFIWVVDLGSRQAEDEGAFARYYNAGSLALNFSSFANFGSALDRDPTNAGPISQRLSLPDDRKRLFRWQWLKEHAVVVIQSGGHSEIERLYREEDSNLRSIRLQSDRLNLEHILPRTVPSTWAKPLEKLYNRKINDLESATLSISYKKNASKKSTRNQIGVQYLAGASIERKSSDSKNVDDEAWIVDTIQLPSPGRRYDEAYHVIYYASSYRLSKSKDDLDQRFAMAYLKKSGFEILRADDFIKIFGIVESLPE